MAEVRGRSAAVPAPFGENIFGELLFGENVSANALFVEKPFAEYFFGERTFWRMNFSAKKLMFAFID